MGAWSSGRASASSFFLDSRNVLLCRRIQSTFRCRPSRPDENPPRWRSESARRGAPKYPIESVDSAIRLLKLIAADEAVTVSAAARQLGVAPSTAHRLLAMLEYHQLIEAGDRRARLPARPVDARAGAGDGPRLRHPRPGAAAPGTAGRRGRRDRPRDQSAGRPTRSSSTASSAARRCAPPTAPANGCRPHSSAGGKVQLARLGEERVLELYPEEQLRGLTDSSIRSRTDLLRELDARCAAPATRSTAARARQTYTRSPRPSSTAEVRCAVPRRSRAQPPA